MSQQKTSKVIILGSAALKIGEAGEFDYSGSQAIKALKEEGIYTVLINPNIATIQTSEHLADRVYFLPVNRHFVEKVIEKEQPDGILLSFGGQTALNCGLELFHKGVLKKYDVKVLGTPVTTIIDTEDRERFVKKLQEIDVKTARSKAAASIDEAVKIAKEIGYPVMIRTAYALGGLGSGICGNIEEVKQLAGKGLSHSSQILVEEYLEGWKEIEYEVMRDKFNNCITVCNMENLDPMGIHTGESIVIAPSQTLTNREYHFLREIAIKVIRHLGIVGECNIQYALDSHSDDYRIIEVNARLSRSSALASKATGYPLAFVAAKVALGYGLHQLPNSITKITKAFFEPALDYVVVKIPRWDLKKFRRVSRKIGSGMKSVGEVMAIGRKFEEALQKALRMLAIGAEGLVANNSLFQFEDLKNELKEPTEERIFAVVKALKLGYTVDQIFDLSHIDKWFLYKIAHVVEIEDKLFRSSKPQIPKNLLSEAKQAGFSDQQIANITNQTCQVISKLRQVNGLRPFIRQIDTFGAEYPAKTNYLYLTYNSQEDDIPFPEKNTVIILGSGAYRIGSSVEFDWCCVNTGKTLRQLGYHTVMLNYNPETVSTDYDEFDKLLFDEISQEIVQDICGILQPVGVIVSMGGQIPNNLALKLHQSGIPILGTSAESIDRAENRHKFSSLLDELNIDQPEWEELNAIEEAKSFANKAGYPVLVRPSYVLSGAAMAVACNDMELNQYLGNAAKVSPEHPIVISKFLENAKEIELDAVAQNGEIVADAISEHVENAGVHSGDATIVIPPQRTFLETIRQVRAIGKKIAASLHINGPFNIQFLAKDNKVKVIECNLRASRSLPFISKIMKENFIDIAARVIVGRPVNKLEKSLWDLDYVGVKAPQFSFTRLDGADPVLGVEMASTGEVGCLGKDFNEAFLKALISVGYNLSVKTVLLSSGSLASKFALLEYCLLLVKMGVKFYGTHGTAKFLRENQIPAEDLYWPLENQQPGAVDYIKNGKIDLVVNLPKNDQKDELTNGYIIRRAAVDYNVPLITNRQFAQRFMEAFSKKSLHELEVKSWEMY